MESVHKDFVEELIIAGFTYKEVSEELERKYPHIQKGLSSRSVRRYCQIHKLKKLKDDELDQVVDEAIDEVMHL